jgi:simple sugar transport system ATP-binding protein
LLRVEGKSIILITHKLDEVLEVCDRITVLRGGKKIKTVDINEINKKDLASMMFDQEISFLGRENHMRKVDKDIILEIKNISVLNDKNLLAVKDVSFNIHRGEIFGIAGVAGNGQKELVEAITGLRRTVNGNIYILGRDVTNVGPREILDKGVAHVPEERIRMGVVPSMSLEENFILRSYNKEPFSDGLFLRYDVISNHAKELISRYKISALDEKSPAITLSGGNIQKLILARELTISPVLIVASHPTQGLDMKSIQQIHELLLKQKEDGCAVLLISEDIQELLSLSDRIAVMFDGRISGIRNTDETTIEEIGMLMVGGGDRV